MNGSVLFVSGTKFAKIIMLVGYNEIVSANREVDFRCVNSFHKDVKDAFFFGVLLPITK